MTFEVLKGITLVYQNKSKVDNARIVGNVDTDRSFVYFIYPFTFIKGDSSDRVLRIAKEVLNDSDKWRPIETFPEEDMLPHAVHFFKEYKELEAVVHFREMSKNLQKEFGLIDEIKWKLAYPNADSESDATVELGFKFGRTGNSDGVIQIAFFPSGLGFLIISAKPVSDKCSDWLDFVYYFRKINSPKKIWIDFSSVSESNIPSNIKKIKDAHPEGKLVLEDIIDSILESACPIDNDTSKEEIFVRDRMIPFTGLFINDLKDKSTELPLLLYRMRKFFHSGQGILPSETDLALNQQGILPYAKDQWFISSLDGGWFTAFGAPTDDIFFREQFPRHLQKTYFLEFLLVQYQRFTLIMLSEDVAASWPKFKKSGDIGLFEKIRNTLLQFTARGYFSQIMQRSNPDAYYLELQDILHVHRLYNEVSNEVNEMHQFVTLNQAEESRKRGKGFENRVEQFGIIFAVLALVTGFLGVNLNSITCKDGGITIRSAIGTLAITFIIIFMITNLIYRKHS